MASSGIPRLPKQAQAEETEKRSGQPIDPALGDEIEVAHGARSEE
jgi:hypothetical protein